jgi:hypothetical protein
MEWPAGLLSADSAPWSSISGGKRKDLRATCQMGRKVLVCQKCTKYDSPSRRIHHSFAYFCPRILSQCGSQYECKARERFSIRMLRLVSTFPIFFPLARSQAILASTTRKRDVLNYIFFTSKLTYVKFCVSAYTPFSPDPWT